MSDGPAYLDSSTHTTLQFCIHALSGKSLPITTCRSSSTHEFGASIEDLLGIPFKNQRWIKDGSEILFKEFATIGETDLQTGDRITVVHGGSALLDLPDGFEIILTSVRQRMDAMSSCSFVHMYKIQGNSAEAWLYYEPRRKNDCDRYLFDVEADTMHAVSSKWMTWRRSLGGRNPLHPFCLGWSSSQKQVSDVEKSFWRTEVSAVGQEGDSGENGQAETGTLKDSQTSPDYTAVPGWFVMPSEDLCEVEVDVPLPFIFGHCAKILRLLINKTGVPVRAAVQGGKVGFPHQEIEEFDVDFLPSRDSLKSLRESLRL